MSQFTIPMIRPDCEKFYASCRSFGVVSRRRHGLGLMICYSRKSARSGARQSDADSGIRETGGWVMPVQVSYPGVYIDEQLSGAHTITPVSTSVTAFIGMARRGRLGTPTRVSNLAQFQTLYGSDASMGELVPQVGQFFLNGGSTAWITRIAHGAASAAVTLNNEANPPAAVLRLTANDAGEDGNLIRAEVNYNTANPEGTFNLTLYRRLVGPTGTVTQDGLETFTNLSMNPASGRFVETVVNSSSQLVTAQVDAGVAAMVNNVPGVSISGLMSRRPTPTSSPPSSSASGTIRLIRAVS